MLQYQKYTRITFIIFMLMCDVLLIGNFGACKIILRPSIEGSGVIAGGAVRTVLEVAGIKNVIAKQLGSNNLLNNAHASISTLKILTTKSEVFKKRDVFSN